MKRFFILFLLSSIASVAFAQCTFNNFYKYYFYQAPTTKTIATSDGGFITVTGAAYDTLNPGTKNGQDEDMCVVKTDSCGSTQWTTHYGYPGEGDDAIDVVETDSGDYLVTGVAAFQQAFHNIRVARFSKDGKLLWAKLYSGTTESYPHSIINRKNRKSYIVCGETDYTGSLTKGYIIEINSSGQVLKNKEFPNLNMSILRIFEKNDTSYLMLVDIFSTGKDSLCLMETDTNFAIRWIKNIGFSRLDGFYNSCLSHDTKRIGLLIDGAIQPSGFSHGTIVIVDLNGNLVNYKIIPQDTFGYTVGIAPTNDNGFVVTNNHVMKLDSALNRQWMKPFTLGALISVCVTKDGSIAGSGVCSAFDSVNWNLYVAKIDSSGNFAHTGINEASTSLNTSINLYPNPSSGKIHIQTKNNETINTMKLYDFTGKEINISIPEMHSTEITIDATNLKSGIYFMMINGVAHKMIKQ